MLNEYECEHGHVDGNGHGLGHSDGQGCRHRHGHGYGHGREHLYHSWCSVPCLWNSKEFSAQNSTEFREERNTILVLHIRRYSGI